MNFILSEFNKEKIIVIDDYNKHVYNTDSIIYGSSKFCDTMINSFLPIPMYNTKITDTDIGYISVYHGIEVYFHPRTTEYNWYNDA